MRHRADSLKVMWACLAILVPSSDGGRSAKKHAAPCRPKELSALTKSQVAASLTGFDEANGEHLGTWSPGFPKLQVQQNSSLHGSRVQCCLLFMAQGLEKIREDQERNLNPGNTSLCNNLRDAVKRVNMLALCLKSFLGGECLPEPLPPKMPKQVFERKQWSHTLLETARKYLSWLEHKIGRQTIRFRGQNNFKHTEAAHKSYLEGNGHML